MRWSFSVARIFGIDLRLHITFFLIFLLAGAQWSEHGLTGLLFSTALILLLFACVTLHEFGHALMAKRLGIGVREIVLLPIGGMAMLSRNPSKPMQEFMITIAGPLVNVLLAAVLFVVFIAKTSLGLIDLNSLATAPFMAPSVTTALIWLLVANIAMVVFNLIPAFPLDGGRLLRASLGFFLPWTTATTIATFIGQGIAILLGAFALASGMWVLLLIAVVIYLNAGSARLHEDTQRVLARGTVGQAFKRDAVVLSEHHRIRNLVDLLMNSHQADYAVLRDGELLGIVRRDDALEAFTASRGDLPVTEIMSRDAPLLRSDLPLDKAAQQLNESGAGVGVVHDGRRFLGLLGMRDIAQASMILKYLFVHGRGAASTFKPQAVSGGDN